MGLHKINEKSELLWLVVQFCWCYFLCVLSYILNGCWILDFHCKAILRF